MSTSTEPQGKVLQDRSKGLMTDTVIKRMDDHLSCPQNKTLEAVNTCSLTEADIPQLRKQWIDTCRDIMQGVPPRLPPYRVIVHRIPLIDEAKRYKYRLPCCPDALKPQLMDKIKRYTEAGWWERVHTDQAAPMLCIPKKNRKLRTPIDLRQRNENMVKDQIRMDVARALITSKIDFSDTYEQVRVHKDDLMKTAFATG